MKLIRLKLKNFASIWAGMNKKEIDIDFSLCENCITLLVGKNGSGKTSLLSNIHPFPYLGTLDIRNTQDLILEGKEGLKIFEFEDGDDHYKAEHHYLIQSGRRKTVCFLKKNGKELNPSGLVKTFYDVINMEFGLDQAFLRVIRLGPNVNDIITMKASERKDFISTFLSEIDIYTQCFKVANEESKFIKNRLKLVTSEYDKLDDVSEMKMLKETLTKDIDNKVKAKDKSVKELFELKGEMKAKILEDHIIDTYIEEYNKNIKLLESDKFTNEFILEQRSLKSDIQSKISSLEYKLQFLDTERQKLSLEILDNNTELVDAQNKIKLISQNNSIQFIDESIDKLEKERDSLLVLDKEPSITKAEALVIRSDIDTIKDKFRSLMEYHPSFISKTRSLIKDRKAIKVSKYINEEADYRLKEISEEIAAVKLMSESGIGKGSILFVPSECESFKKCPYYNTFHKNKNTSKSIEKLNQQFESYLEYKNYGRDLNEVLTLCSKENLKGFVNPFDQMLVLYLSNPGLIENHLEVGINSVDSIISTHEKLEREAQIITRIAELKVERASIADLGSINILEDQIKRLESKNLELESKRSNMDSDIDATRYQIEDLKRDLEVVTENCDTIAKYEDIILRKDSIIDNYYHAVGSLELKASCDERVYQYEKEIKELEELIKTGRSNIENLTYKIMKKEELEVQKSEIEDRFEYVELIKESLSSTKGIPLIFIQLYLKNIQIFANQIIHSMFDDSISLCDFIITDKEFSIPYKVNGIEVTDISYASQGQRATISLALSFAILQQFISKYNILLLDEMDGPLYKDNKEKFVRIIEEQMERIGCDQCIMITHNNIFENYPVDIIFTSDLEVNDYNKSNVIWQV